MKRFFRSITPPILWDALKFLRKKPMRRSEKPVFEYLSEGWDYVSGHPEVRGWNVDEILQAYKRNWDSFAESTRGKGPLSLTPEGTGSGADINGHNNLMVFAYSLALCAQQKKEISMLDWGGAIGHYYLLAKAVLPQHRIDYYCKDTVIFASHGQTLFPEAHFYSDQDCLLRQYDFVLASGSLQYCTDWKDILNLLANSTQGYMLITRLPVITVAESYVFIQRPYAFRYNTEYLAWCLNRAQFLEAATFTGLDLVREFVIGDSHHIQAAPEQPSYRGFLFRKLK